MSAKVDIQARLAQYAPTRLQVELSRLRERERRMIPLLIEAAQAMDEPFWIQNYGEREALLSSSTDPDIRRYMQMNYGPWDRLHGNEAFIAGMGPKPPGANFYPPDTTRDEIDILIGPMEAEDLERDNNRIDAANLPLGLVVKRL